MSQPLLELQRLLVGRASVAGRVISIGDGVLRVATPGGIVEVAAVTGIGVGDNVTIRNGSASHLTNGTNVPVFFV